MSKFTSKEAWLAAILLSGMAALSANAQVPDSILEEEPATSSAPRIPDRIEGVNRVIFNFNDGVYRFVLKPISKGYSAVVPRPVRKGIGNFFYNLGFPTRFVGNVLEGRPRGAAVETGRFVVNTLAGVGGIFTPAKDMPGLRIAETDLGQAFGTWGVGHGTYVVLPIMGPTSVRDGIGQIASGIWLSPVHYLPEWEQRAVASGVDGVNDMPELMQGYDNLKAGALDPYIALRDAYSSRRAEQVRQQKNPTAVEDATGQADATAKPGI